MKNYEEILTDAGIEIPADKKDTIKKAMGENYKTVEDYNKASSTRDKYKKELEDVQTKLDGFKDVDVEDLKNQIATLTADLNNEKTARAAEAKKAEIEKTVGSFLSGKKFVNALTEKSIKNSLIEELDKDSAKGKSIEDIFNGLITGEDGKQMENILADDGGSGKKAHFTTAFKGSGTGGTLTKDDFKKMSLDERIKLKTKDPELYKTLS